MQALEGWLISRWRYAVLLALAALLAGAAVALNARQSVDAQTTVANAMQTGDNDDRTNFRLELSLVDDSDNIVPAGSSLRVKAVVKFDVPSDKTEGLAVDDHGNFGPIIHVQAGGTLRIAGQFEWENAGGRTLRIDPERQGGTDYDPPVSHASDAVQHANCKNPVNTGDFVDDFTDTAGRVLYSTTVAAQRNAGELDCTTPPTTANGRVLDPHPEDWKRITYSQRGIIGNTLDALPDRDGDQAACSPTTADDVTTWTCEIVLVDEQFGWRGYSGYAALNGILPETGNSGNNWQAWALLAQRFVQNDTDASITIPAGTSDGSFTISGSVVLHSALGRVPAQAANNDDKITLTDSLAVTVGTVSEAHSASFGFAPQTTTSQPSTNAQVGEPWPKQVPASDGETKLRLQILNENGKPSARNSLSSIVMRTNLGTLQSNISDGGSGTSDGCLGNGALTCQVVVANLNTTNSGNIIFTLKSPANNKAGTAQVTGSVVNSRGEVLTIETLTVVFTGTASKLTLSEPASSILNMVTTGDNRDQLTLSVSATDTADQTAGVPTRSRATTIKGPDGRNITQSDSTIKADWPLMSTADTPAPVLDAAGNLQARIIVGAAAGSALTAGEYTLEVRAGGLRASQTFTVSGGPSAIALAASESEYNLNDQFTLTATLTNADGTTVPDGTPVAFATGSANNQPKIVQLRATTGTKNGEASATYVVIAEGRTWVTVASGTATGFWSESVGAPAVPAGAADPASALSARAGLVSYLGDAEVSAKAMLEALGNVTAIRLYDRANRVWVLYGVVEGRELPGSDNFDITRGAVLWIGS